ncbi:MULTISPECIES: ARPP-2 domain-containing protein [Streptomyces]|uniref:ARG and Rhodanese-Phosphatase-superfamily-associated domain-containing protein n=1 Tax=Streptomyces fimbriatus TaxID=68197 RepID=A0ABW0D936_STRFI
MTPPDPTGPEPTGPDLTGLDTRPSQVWGAVRLVPLVRDEPVEDLRLHARPYGDVTGLVEVRPRHAYVSYVPHGFVATWTGDGTPAAAYGTQMSPGGDSPPTATAGLRFHRRTARREAGQRLRFLPLHLALEGYLALHFGGPPIAWEEWSQRAIRQGLSPRAEEAYLGADVRGLADALRVFEIHPGQCGMLLYVADALAAAFAVPHPDDYRALHPTLLQDLFGELIHHYATLMPPVPDFRARVDDARIRSLAELRTAVAGQEDAWARFHDTTMAHGLLHHAYTWRTVHKLGRFTLSRFLPVFRPKEENHIGEAITDEGGGVVYLKTFRLSESQVRRGHLLDRLAAHDWHLADTAAGLGVTEAQLGLRLESAGFGHLLRQDVLDGYRSRGRTPSR